MQLQVNSFLMASYDNQKQRKYTWLQLPNITRVISKFFPNIAKQHPNPLFFRKGIA
jgi:hypothetical protein